MNKTNKTVLPSIEDVYDMTLDQLDKIKIATEEKRYVTVEQEDNDEDDWVDNLYRFILSEIKQRRFMDNVIEFFMKNDIADIVTPILNKEIVCSDNEIISKRNRSNIKQLLQKTKLDGNVRFIVGGSTVNRNIRTAPHKQLSLPIINEMANDKIRAAKTKVNFHPKKLPMPKKTKKKKRTNSLTPLEVRRNYKVPDITAFIPKMIPIKRKITFPSVKKENKKGSSEGNKIEHNHFEFVSKVECVDIPKESEEYLNKDHYVFKHSSICINSNDKQETDTSTNKNSVSVGMMRHTIEDMVQVGSPIINSFDNKELHIKQLKKKRTIEDMVFITMPTSKIPHPTTRLVHNSNEDTEPQLHLALENELQAVIQEEETQPNEESNLNKADNEYDLNEDKLINTAKQHIQLESRQLSELVISHSNKNINKNNIQDIITKKIYTKGKTSSNFFNTYRKPSAANKIKVRSTSSKIQSINLPLPFYIDYSQFYSTFNDIFNGYHISKDSFNLFNVMTNLYESFLLMERIEDSESIIQRDLTKETEVINNRIKSVSERLLSDDKANDQFLLLKDLLDRQKQTKREDASTSGTMFFRVVLSKPEIYDIVCYTLGLKQNWRELPHGMNLGLSWNLLWTYTTPSVDTGKIFTFQKVNHLCDNRHIARKDFLKKSIERATKVNKTFDIMPTTFILAKEYIPFVEEFTRSTQSGQENLWIVKPVGKSRGRGIYLINKVSDVPMLDSFLVQRYITNPLLIEGRKFDMRIYVLVTSVNPLEVFIYKEGFARLSTEMFSINELDRKIHLTNAAIHNKLCRNENNYEKMIGGSKITLSMLKGKLNAMDVNFDGIWRQVKEIVVKCLAAGQYEMPHSPSSFELFGFDIIIDNNLKCWLLEVNSSPSLDRTTILDDQVKLPLIDDVIKIVDPVDFDRKALIRVLQRRLNVTNNQGSDVYLYSPLIQMNLDLTNIFRGKLPRKFGDVPMNIGNFEMLCPTKFSLEITEILGEKRK